MKGFLVAFVIILLVVEHITANEECPGDPSKVEAGRKCRKKCSSDKQCKGSSKGCHCDNVCGMSCFNINAECKPPPPFENGRIFGDDYVHGSTIEYSCDEGYILKGQSRRTCHADRNWGGQVPVCELGCSSPSREPNSFADVDADGFPVGTKINYKCLFGYNMIGDSEIECLDNYIWSEPKFECVGVSCGDPGSPINGYIEGNNFFFGSWITYRCDKGYTIDSEFRVRRYCSTTGQWSGEPRTCSKIKCQPPGKLENGFVDITGATFDFRSLISYRCLPGYQLVGNSEGECNEEGDWGAIPTCSVDVNCNFDGGSNTLCGYTNEGEGKWETHFLQDNTLSGNPTYVLRASSVPAIFRSPVIPTDQPYCFKFHYYIRRFSGKNSFIIASMNGEKIIARVRGKERRAQWLNQQITIHPLLFFGGIQYDITLTEEGTKIDLDDFSLSEGICKTNCLAKTCLHDGVCIDRVGTYTCICSRFYGGKNCQYEITCRSPPEVKFGSFEITPDPEKYRVDTMGKFSCDKGYKQTSGPKMITCLENGRWSDRRRPVCKEILCPDVLRPTGGTMVKKVKDPSKMSIGSVVYFYCPIGKFLHGRSKAIVCMPNGKWSNQNKGLCVSRKIYSTECPTEYRKMDNMCYKEYAIATFNDATQRCASFGASISIIRSEDERERLEKIVSPRRLYYLGLTDLGTKSLHWSSGDKFEKIVSESYSGNFNPREDVTSDARCGAFVRVNEKSQITNTVCDLKKNFICEIFPSSIKPIQIITNNPSFLEVTGVYRPVMGLSYSGSVVYKQDKIKGLHLVRKKEGWIVGPFDFVKTQPLEGRDAIYTKSNSDLPQHIKDDWKYGSMFPKKEGEFADVTLEIYDLWESWSSWSSCTKTCGGGSTLRTRECGQQGGASGFGDCKGNFLQSKPCNTRQCIITRWGAWRTWTGCSKPCDGGIRMRNRTCIKDPVSLETCKGKTEQIEKCNVQECLPETSSWIRLDVLEYKIVSKSLSQTDALKDCGVENGKLGTVRNSAVWDFLNPLINNVHCSSKSGFKKWKIWATNAIQRESDNPSDAADLAKVGKANSTILCDLIDHSCESPSSWSKSDCNSLAATGHICEREWKPCNSNPCNDGGECTNVDDETHACKCFDNFQGENCETEIRCNVEDLIIRYKVSYALEMIPVVDSHIGKLVQIQLDCLRDGQLTTDNQLFRCVGMDLWNTKKMPHIDCGKSCLLPELSKNIIAKDEDVIVNTGDAFPLDTLLSFECPESMELVGDPTSLCEEEGWDVLPAECVVALPCPRVVSPAVGELEILPKFQKDLLKSGTTITLRCDENHVVIGESKITCGKDGQWKSQLGSCTNKKGCEIKLDNLPKDVKVLSPNFTVVKEDRLFSIGEFAYLLCEKSGGSTFKEISCAGIGIWDTAISTFCS